MMEVRRAVPTGREVTEARVRLWGWGGSGSVCLGANPSAVNIQAEHIFAYVMFSHFSRVRPFETPWDFPGKSTGVGCRFLLLHMS